MATAPRPGAIERAQAAQAGFRITVDGETLTLRVGDLGPADRMACRAETASAFGTSIPLGEFLGDGFESDSIVVLWWLARRKNGARRLKLATVLADFPSDLDLGDRVVVEPLGDTPAEDDEDEDDPLPSAGD